MQYIFATNHSICIVWYGTDCLLVLFKEIKYLHRVPGIKKENTATADG